MELHSGTLRRYQRLLTMGQWVGYRHADTSQAIQLFKLANELLGEPYEDHAAKARASRTPSSKKYVMWSQMEFDEKLKIRLLMSIMKNLN